MSANLQLPSGFLTLPAAEDHAVSRLRRKVHLIALRTALLARPSPPRLARALHPVQDLLQRTARTHKAAVLAAVGDPDVLPLLLASAAGVHDEALSLSQAIPQLLIALFERGAVHEAVLWDYPVEQLLFHGKHAVPAAAEALVVDPAGPEVRVEGATHSLEPADPVRLPLSPSLHLALVDRNPLAMQEAHPDKQGNALSLGDQPVETWATALSQALDLVRLALPTWHAELAHSLQRVVPVGVHAERHFSASYREAPGLCYLSLHPDPLTLAEALVHETQHNKANWLSWLDPVLHNAHSEWARSPVRPDLRPLWGILLAIHAFIPVSALHARLKALGHPISATAQFSQRQQAVYAGNQRGLDAVLASAKPTPAGRKLLDALTGLHQALPRPTATLDPEALPPG